MIRNIFVTFIMLFFFVGCSVETGQNRVTTPNQPIQLQKTAPKKEIVKKTKEKSIFALETKTYTFNKPVEKKIDKKDFIAIVYPSSEINRYALEATNTINGYLLQVHKDKPYHLESFDILVQTKQNIVKAFDEISKKNISKVILMITKDYLNVLKDIQGIDKFNIVLPLINKNEIEYDKRFKDMNLLFAGISYKDQFDKLIQYTRGYPLVEFYDNSSIGTALHTFLSKHPIKYSRRINDNNGRYKAIVKSIRSRLDRSALILNTPIVKSSMLLSALTSEEVIPRAILSTQLNFTPLVFSLTQKIDRNNLIIASSIGKLPDPLESYSELLGNNVMYNWVNYSCMVATEYLQTGDIELFSDLSIVNHQIKYPVKLYKVKRNSFTLIPF